MDQPLLVALGTAHAGSQRLVENPLALRLLEGDFADGDTIRIDADGDELVFVKAEAAAPAAV